MVPGANEDSSRKTIEELITRYDLHPEFRDVYVEGEWDRRVLLWLLRAGGVRGVAVYDIDGIDIPGSVLKKYALPEGKKERVVALAYELQGHVSEPAQVTCIADRDYDTVLGIRHSSPLLFLTDYSCQEMYLFCESIFGKFLSLVVGCSAVAPKDVIANLLENLQELHLCRAANLSLKWGMKWIEPDKCSKIDGNLLRVDMSEFTTKYLSKNARLKDREAFTTELARLRGKLTTNPLLHVSKHDLFSLLSILLPRFCKEPAFHQPRYIAQSLAGCAEPAIMLEYPLYKSLIDRMKA